MTFHLEYYDMNGKKVNASQWADTLTRQLVDQIITQYIEQATSIVSKMQCPKHGEIAILTFKVEESPEQLSINMQANACCDDFAEKTVQQAQNVLS